MILWGVGVNRLFKSWVWIKKEWRVYGMGMGFRIDYKLLELCCYNHCHRSKVGFRIDYKLLELQAELDELPDVSMF